MAPGYRSASDITSPFGDPLLLAPDAVRCLWVRPVPDDRGEAVPTVVFRDGTHYPLSPSLAEIEARKTCLRIGTIYDWPIWDMRLPDIGHSIRATATLSSLQDDEHVVVDEQSCLTMLGLGRLLATIAHTEGWFLGEAVSKITHQIVLFFDLVKEQTVLTGIALEEAMQDAINAGFERLCVLYPDGNDASPQASHSKEKKPEQFHGAEDALILSGNEETALACQPFLLFDRCLALVRGTSAGT